MKRFLNRRSVRAGLCLVAVALAAGFVASLYVAQSLTAPSKQSVGSLSGRIPTELIKLTSANGETLSGWHMRSSTETGVVVLLHGIRSNRLSMLRRARELFDRQFSVVMIDFQSHGESTGDQITAGHLERHDVAAAISYARLHHVGEPVGVIGVSMGGASALLAMPQPIDALVVESVYPDITTAIRNRVSTRLGPFAGLPTTMLLWQLGPRLGIKPDQLRPIDGVQKTNCPILIASGSLDRYTPESETRLLFSNAKQPKQLWMVPKLGHEDLFNGASEDYREHIFGFLEQEMRGGKKSAHSRQEEGSL